MDRKDKGEEIIVKVWGALDEKRGPAFEEMDTITCDYLFGEIWSREGLALRDRSLVTVSILVATGKEKQLKTHMRGALSNGVTPNELKEVMIHAAHYCGWPSGVNGLSVLQALIDEENLSLVNESNK